MFFLFSPLQCHRIIWVRKKKKIDPDIQMRVCPACWSKNDWLATSCAHKVEAKTAGGNRESRLSEISASVIVLHRIRIMILRKSGRVLSDVDLQTEKCPERNWHPLKSFVINLLPNHVR